MASQQHNVGKDARQLHENPGLGAGLTAEAGDSAEERKQKLFTLLAELSDVAWSDVRRFRATVPPLGLADRPAFGEGAATPIDPFTLLPGLRDGSYGGDVEYPYGVAIEFGMRPDVSSLRRDPHLTQVRQAAALMRTLPSATHARPAGHPDTDEGDLDFVLGVIRDGAMFGSDVVKNLLTVLPQVVARDHPGVTAQEMAEIARNSHNLIQLTTRLNQRQLAAFLRALCVPPESEEDYEAWKRAGGEDQPLHPGNFRYDPQTRRVNFRKLPEEFTAFDEHDPAAPKTVQVKAFTIDEMDIESAEGCPARFRLGLHASPVRDQWNDLVELLAPQWNYAMPHHRFAAVPEELEALLGRDDVSELALAGARGVEVHVRRAVTRQFGVDTDDPAVLDALSFHGDGQRVTIGGDVPATRSGREPVLIVFLPTADGRLRAHGSTRIRAEGVDHFDVTLPAGGSFIGRGGGRLVAHPMSVALVALTGQSLSVAVPSPGTSVSRARPPIALVRAEFDAVPQVADTARSLVTEVPSHVPLGAVLSSVDRRLVAELAGEEQMLGRIKAMRVAPPAAPALPLRGGRPACSHAPDPTSPQRPPDRRRPPR